MARRPFGGATTDLVAGNSNGLLAVTATSVTFWTAQTGGTRITDLLNNAGTAVTAITCDANGQLPVFQGPADGTDVMWADAGGPSRRMIFASDFTSRLKALEVTGTGQNAAPLASPVFTGTPTAPTPANGDNDNSIATTAFVQAAVAGLAPNVSPAFTGDPTVPTATPGDNDLSIANTAYVTYVQAALDARIATIEAALAGTGGGTTPPATGTVLFNGDFSGGNTTQWSYEHNLSATVTVYDATNRPNGGSAQPGLAPLPPAGLQYAAKFYTYGADTDGANVRSQLRAASTPYHAGDDVYFYGWTYFPAGFPTIDSAVVSGEYFMFFETFGDPYSGSPNGGLYVSADNHGGVNHLVARDATGVEEWLGPALTTNRWYHFIIRKYFQQNNTGFLEIWLDGVQQTMTNGTTRWNIPTQTSGETSSYQIINCYFKRNAHPNITIYHAGWRSGTSLDLAMASYSPVNPAAPSLITGNRLTLNQQDVETDLTGITAGTNTTISRVTGGHTGTYAVRGVPTTTGTIEIVLADAPVSASTAYNVTVWIKPDTGTPALSGQFFANAHDSAGSYISTLTGTTFTSNSTWTQVTWNVTTPAGTGKLQVVVDLYAAPSGQAYLFDTMSIVAA